MAGGVVRLADYRPFPYHIRHVQLDVALDAEETRVRATLQIAAKSAGDRPPLVLDGGDLDLRAVRIDGQDLADAAYRAEPDRLIIHAPPAQFTLETEVVIRPSRNASRKGLFWHEGFLATQCEAEGFRRITYFPDRPDVLSIYEVRLEAERETFPVLLSNGEAGQHGAGGSRHWVVWRDPYPKPSYIFAIMAGRFDALRHSFVTASGRPVDVAIFAAPGEAERCRFALSSLHAAFAWDEQVFGLEYDLTTYNIVALPGYAGAQENKGLNLFGAAGIIADPAITTDEEATLIKRIIGHEYFHNWTGNRVTCRDWFQLSLKEGLTRLRDQLFMEDALEPGTFRIEQVKALRRNQFPEDDGPAAHPVQPVEFVEIENFYTTTIYDKGAEVLRMARTIIGEQAFVEAIKAYLARYDGQAVTIEDLLATIEQVSGHDLRQFRQWLRQAGRPTVRVETGFDAAKGEARFIFTQHLPDQPGPGGPLHIPVQLALFDPGGGRLGEPRLVQLTRPSETLTIGGLERQPIASILRGFSAPISLDFAPPDADLVYLALSDDDPFVAWNSAQQLFTKVIRTLSFAPAAQMQALVPDHVIDLVERMIAMAPQCPGLTAQKLALPDEPVLSEGLAQIRLDEHALARQAVKRAIAQTLRDRVHRAYRELPAFDPDDRSREAMAGRSLRSALLDLMVAAGDEDSVGLCLAQIVEGPSITEKFDALCLIGDCAHPARAAAFDGFLACYQSQPLVVDKWFKAQALSRAPGVIDAIIALEQHPTFDLGNTARVLAYYGSLFRQNRIAFHDRSGKGYRFLADRLLLMDQIGRGHPGYFMAQMDQWRRYDAPRRALMEQELIRIAETPGISGGLREVVGRTLGRSG
jgi:aminopeptidase N